MTRWRLIPLIALLSGCNAAPDAQSAGSAPAVAAPSVVIAQKPPAAKDVIDAVIRSGNVPLSVSPTCQNVGTEPADATIGRYLAGFMAEMRQPDKSNWIETDVQSGNSEGESVWICRLTLRHVAGDDRWGWGVQFHVRQRDGAVLPNSFTCTGAG
jgi:hypothetical protein